MAFPLAALFPVIGKVLDRVLPDEAAKAAAQLELLKLQQDGEFRELEAAVRVVEAEAKSEHWLTATWRPITMLAFTAVIANNWLLYPYLRLFWADAPLLEMPPEMWNLLTVGLGGYTISRSVEKSVKAWKSNGAQ